MSNQHVQELLSRIKNRYSVDSINMTMGDWICQNTHLRGRPFSFQRYPFQEQIVNDLHPNMDVIKPSQIGLSEVQVRKALAFLARNRGTSLIFTLPNEAMFERMSTTRILPIVKEEKVFNLETRSGEKPTRSRAIIQIGSSFMYVTGASEGDATSISADAVFNDEVDLTDQQMLALFNSRLQNSDWKLNQRFSTPTFNNFGIDQGYQVSDQHEYLKKCECCNHWQTPVFSRKFVDIPGLPDDLEFLHEIDQALIDTGSLDVLNAQVICEKCHAPMDLGTGREWVATYPSRTLARGYRVRPFSTNRLGPDYIIQQLLKYKARDHIRGWYNTVLGEPFTAGNARLSDADIEQCFTHRSLVPDVDRSRPTWIGIDAGQTCHVTIGQGESVENMDVIEFRTIPADDLIAQVGTYLDIYNVVGGAIDRHPYTPTANALRDMSQGRIQPVEYRGTKRLNLVKDEIDPDRILHVQSDRTWMIDEIVRVIRAKRIRFSGFGQQKSVIVEHLKDMVRDENPEKPATWVKLTGNDHYFHALAFLLVGVQIKEFEQGTTQDPRSAVVVDVVNTSGVNSTLSTINRKANRGIV